MPIPKIIIPVALCLSLHMIINGQTNPFPRNEAYPNGYIPSTLSIGEVQATYNQWKNSLLRDCYGSLRVGGDPIDETRVEAIGFGMLLTAYHGDKDEFDGLQRFYNEKRTLEAANLMAWSVTCDDINDRNNATDGDIDVAFALIVAYNQWGGDYLDDALEIIDILSDFFIVNCGDTIIALRPGNGWGGCALTDIQYYTPGFFRVFAEVSGDTVWNTLADDAYRIRDASAHPVTGLVPDWQGVNGTPSGSPPQANRNGTYAYDACRVPWRMALDYLWNGDTTAGNWCTKVSDWAYGVGPANINDGYLLDGTPYNSGNHNSAFAGGFTVAAMCNSQAIVDEFGADLEGIPDQYWFNLCTRCLYLLTATGNMWKPETNFVDATAVTIQGEGGVNSITTDNQTLQMEGVFTPENTTVTFMDWEIISGSEYASIDINGLLTPVENGTVTVKGTTTDGSDLSDEVDITIENQVDALSDHNTLENVKLYISPSDENVLIIEGVRDIEQIEIISVSGQVFISLSDINSDRINLDISSLVKGNHLVRLRDKDGCKEALKFIK